MDNAGTFRRVVMVMALARRLAILVTLGMLMENNKQKYNSCVRLILCVQENF